MRDTQNPANGKTAGTTANQKNSGARGSGFDQPRNPQTQTTGSFYSRYKTNNPYRKNSHLHAKLAAYIVSNAQWVDDLRRDGYILDSGIAENSMTGGAGKLYYNQTWLMLKKGNLANVYIWIFVDAMPGQSKRVNFMPDGSLGSDLPRTPSDAMDSVLADHINRDIVERYPDLKRTSQEDLRVELLEPRYVYTRDYGVLSEETENELFAELATDALIITGEALEQASGSTFFLDLESKRNEGYEISVRVRKPEELGSENLTPETLACTMAVSSDLVPSMQGGDEVYKSLNSSSARLEMGTALTTIDVSYTKIPIPTAPGQPQAFKEAFNPVFKIAEVLQTGTPSMANYFTTLMNSINSLRSPEAIYKGFDVDTVGVLNLVCNLDNEKNPKSVKFKNMDMYRMFVDECITKDSIYQTVISLDSKNIPFSRFIYYSAIGDRGCDNVIFDVLDRVTNGRFRARLPEGTTFAIGAPIIGYTGTFRPARDLRSLAEFSNLFTMCSVPNDLKLQGIWRNSELCTNPDEALAMKLYVMNVISGYNVDIRDKNYTVNIHPAVIEAWTQAIVDLRIGWQSNLMDTSQQFGSAWVISPNNQAAIPMHQGPFGGTAQSSQNARVFSGQFNTSPYRRY